MLLSVMKKPSSLLANNGAPKLQTQPSSLRFSSPRETEFTQDWAWGVGAAPTNLPRTLRVSALKVMCPGNPSFLGKLAWSSGRTLMSLRPQTTEDSQMEL